MRRGAHLAVLAVLLAAPDAQAQEAPLSLVAATVRAHGHACARAVTLTHDRDAPRGSEAWLVRCDGGTGFRVVYDTSRDDPAGARVEPLVVEDK